MVEEGLLTRDDAIARIDPAQLDHLLHPTARPGRRLRRRRRRASRPRPAPRRARRLRRRHRGGARPAGEDVILVRWETSPDDIHGLVAAKGILTAHGGIASHAALVARGMGKPCVAGCADADDRPRAPSRDDRRPHGRRGRRDHRSTAAPAASSSARSSSCRPGINDDLETILGWADDVRRLEVHANADTPADAIEGARVRRAGDRPLPHRAHVLRRGAPARRAGDDPRGRRGRHAAPRSTGCCPSSRATSRGSSRRWPGCR